MIAKGLRIAAACLMVAVPCGTAESARLAEASRAHVQPEAEVVLEGTIEVLIEDSDTGSTTVYFLVAGGQRTRLRFEQRPLNLTTGTRVRVRGRWIEESVFEVRTLERL